MIAVGAPSLSRCRGPSPPPRSSCGLLVESEAALQGHRALQLCLRPPTAQLGNERPSTAGLFLRPPDTAPITAHLRGWFPITPLISNPTCRRGQAGRRQSYKPLKAIKCKDNNEGAACRCQGPGLLPAIAPPPLITAAPLMCRT